MVTPIRFRWFKFYGTVSFMENEKKNKYDFLNQLLGEGDAMVCLDARQPDVDVPKQHKQNAMLNLVFNMSFRRPFVVTQDAIYATLSFGGRPHKCVIPFTSVWAIYEPDTNEGQVWEENIPQDIDLTEEIAKTRAPAPNRKTILKPVAGPASIPSEDKSKRDRSHLRVIK